MFIPDMPDVPPQYAPVIIAQASQAQQSSSNMDRTVGVCHPISNPAGSSIPGAITSAESRSSMSPVLGVKNYFHIVENRAVTGPSTVTVLKNPKHGRLEDMGTFVTDADTRVKTDTGERNYSYIPEAGYLGKDSATLLVEIGGYKVKMVYSFKVEPVAVDDYYKFCPKSYWRISTNSDANGNLTVSSVEYQSPTIAAGATTTDTAALAAILGSSILSSLSVDPSSVTFNLTDLAGGTVDSYPQYAVAANAGSKAGYPLDEVEWNAALVVECAPLRGSPE